MPVRLFTIDPVNSVAGWTDEQSSAEGQAVYEGLLYLSQKLNCVVVAADHYGKAPGQGLRGTSVKETAALFILGTSKRDSDLAARRFMEVRKMKNGRQNIAMDFFMEEYSFTAFRKVEKNGVEKLEQVKVDTLTVRWDGDIHPTSETVADDGPTPQQHKMLTALKDLMRTKGVDDPRWKGRRLQGLARQVPRRQALRHPKRVPKAEEPAKGQVHRRIRLGRQRLAHGRNIGN